MTDDNKLKHIESEYGSGRMLTGEAKAELIKVLDSSIESSTYALSTPVLHLLQAAVAQSHSCAQSQVILHT